MITRVHIENYRSIEGLDFSPTALCALVGENNAGKTNILQAIHSVLGKPWHRVTDFSPTDRLDEDAERDVVIQLDFEPALTHKPYKYGPDITVPRLRFELTQYKRATKSAQKGDPRLIAECLDLDGNAIAEPQEAPRKGKKTPYGPMVNIPGALKEQVPTIYIGTDRSLRSQLPTTRYSLLRRLLEDVDEAVNSSPDPNGEEETIADVFLGKLEEAVAVLRIPEFLELEELLRSRAIENLGMTPEEGEESFRLYFGLGDTFEFFKALRVMVEEYDRLADALQLGDGAQNAIVLAIFQAYERLRKRGAAFLLEEPEMYLHPQKCRFFYRTLRSLSETNQILYSTHSPYFVTIPEYEEVRLVSRSRAGRTKILASDHAPDAGLREKIRKELDPERNEFFFARHVILVEGDTEKLALPEYAHRLGIDLDRLGVSIVEVGGKRSLEAFARIVQSFGLPFTLLFDTDSSDFGGDEEAENEYNETLRRFGPGATIVELQPRYESVLKATLGEETYRDLAQRYGGTSKAIRARRIAEDPDTSIPEPIEQLLTELASTE